jgi:hypothetical protein
MNDDRATSTGHDEELGSGEVLGEVRGDEAVEPSYVCCVPASHRLAPLFFIRIAAPVTWWLQDCSAAGEEQNWRVMPGPAPFTPFVEWSWCGMDNRVKGALKDLITVQRNKAYLGAEVAVGDADGLAEPGADEAGSARDENASAVEVADIVSKQVEAQKDSLIDLLEKDAGPALMDYIRRGY